MLQADETESIDLSTGEKQIKRTKNSEHNTYDAGESSEESLHKGERQFLLPQTHR